MNFDIVILVYEHWKSPHMVYDCSIPTAVFLYDDVRSLYIGDRYVHDVFMVVYYFCSLKSCVENFIIFSKKISEVD